MKKLIIYIFFFSALTLESSCGNGSKENNKKTDSTGTSTDSSGTVKDKKSSLTGDYCFILAEGKDTTKISLHIKSENEITGEMTWQPWEKDGAHGTLSGKMNANKEMELMYDYMIEGYNQTETKVMKMEDGKLRVKVGELIDPKNDGHLYFKDVSKAEYKETLQPVNCK